ncbi:MAG: hypothetical protein GY711_17570 [bacterium]|nr:hypothetical protein [bacterium]
MLDMLRTERMSAGFSGGYDVRGWGHTYALHFLLRLRAAERVPLGMRREVDESVSWLVGVLAETEIVGTGGWNDRVFERSESFGTALAILSLMRPGMPCPADW